MDRNRVSLVLLVLAALLVVSVGILNVQQVANADESAAYQQFAEATPEETRVAPSRPNPTVFTAYGTGGGHLVAIHANGTLWYYSNDHDEYYDVDPVESRRSSVVVAAMDEFGKRECPVSHSCTRESILRVNLSTGEREVLYQRYRPNQGNNEWHDVDRIGESRYLVAGMEKDRVFVVNTSTGIIEWAWDPQSHFSVGTGGSNVFATPAYPTDWTHLNDVELLHDGRIMVSMRNHDQVVFLNRSTGVVEDLTIGENNNYSQLFEQHNPDYIPERDGGPAVVVADSHNNRIVEFQRVNGSWKKSWTWKDADLKWPRDADRLPNGHTLITDTNGNRVLEVDDTGSVAWSIGPLPGVYEAERLGTGDESASGESAKRLGLESTPAPAVDPSRHEANILLNSLRYVAPWWFNVEDGLALLGAGALVITAGLLQISRVKTALVRVKRYVCE